MLNKKYNITKSSLIKDNFLAEKDYIENIFQNKIYNGFLIIQEAYY